MTNRKPLAAVKRLPLFKSNLQTNAVKLAPHGHRHALQTLMHLIFEPEFADHLKLRLDAQ